MNIDQQFLPELEELLRNLRQSLTDLTQLLIHFSNTFENYYRHYSLHRYWYPAGYTYYFPSTQSGPAYSHTYSQPQQSENTGIFIPPSPPTFPRRRPARIHTPTTPSILSDIHSPSTINPSTNRFVSRHPHHHSY